MNTSFNTSTVGSASGSRESQIPSEINLLAKAIGEHTKCVESLSSQLVPVMRQEAETPPRDGKAAPLESRVQVAEMVRDQRFRIEQSTSVIQNLLERLEV